MSPELWYIAPWLLLALVLWLKRPRGKECDLSSFDIITILVLSERKSGRTP